MKKYKMSCIHIDIWTERGEMLGDCLLGKLDETFGCCPINCFYFNEDYCGKHNMPKYICPCNAEGSKPEISIFEEV